MTRNCSSNARAFLFHSKITPFLGYLGILLQHSWSHSRWRNVDQPELFSCLVIGGSRWHQVLVNKMGEKQSRTHIKHCCQDNCGDVRRNFVVTEENTFGGHSLPDFPHFLSQILQKIKIILFIHCTGFVKKINKYHTLGTPVN